MKTRQLIPTRSPRAGPTPKAGGETVDDEADSMEKYGKDPRPLLTSGDPAAGWVVPAKGSLGQIASVPELDAALAAAEERSKVVVVKFFAPWCTSCKVRQLLESSHVNSHTATKGAVAYCNA